MSGHIEVHRANADRTFRDVSTFPTGRQWNMVVAIKLVEYMNGWT